MAIPDQVMNTIDDITSQINSRCSALEKQCETHANSIKNVLSEFNLQAERTNAKICSYSGACSEAIVAASAATLQDSLKLARDTIFPAVQKATAASIHAVLGSQVASQESRIAQLDSKLGALIWMQTWC